MKRSEKPDKYQVVTVNPHDRFFKEVFTRRDVAAEFFQLYLPADIVVQLDLSSLIYIKDSFVDKDLREYYSDLLFSAPLKDGSSTYLYILLEHKSFEEKTTAFQLLRYILNIWDMALKKPEEITFPVIIPVVLYHGEQSWRIGTSLKDLVTYPDLFTKFLPDFEFILWDASTYNDEDIKGTVILQVALLLFRHIFRKDLHDRLLDILALLRELVQKRTGREYLETVIRYLLAAAPKDSVSRDEIKDAVGKAIPKIGGHIVVTIADTLIEEGMERGLQQGKLQNARENIIDILQVRFYEVPPHSLMKAIENIQDLSALKVLLRKAAQADSLEAFQDFLADMPI